MSDELLNLPISPLDAPHDRSADAPYYGALEQARDGGRRQSRQRAQLRRPAVPAPARSPAARPSARDDVRGTNLDVTV
jgi:hypothetical protein